MCSRFSELEKQITRIDTLEQTVSFLQNKITDLEDRSRRSNLLVFGIEEEPDENEDILKKKFLMIFSPKNLVFPAPL